MGLQVLEEWCDLLGKLQAMELAWPVCLAGIPRIRCFRFQVHQILH